MLPIGDENPHPPGFKPKLTYALIAINVIIFFFEVAVTGQFFEFHVMGDTSTGIPAVGASGAISGVLGAYLVIFPHARVKTFLMLGFFWRMLHIKAMYFLPFWLIFQNLLPFFIGGFGVAGGGVAYLAHIGGFVLGLAVGYIYRKSHGSQFTYGTRYGYRGDYR